jgi:hypothetical protein
MRVGWVDKFLGQEASVVIVRSAPRRWMRRRAARVPAEPNRLNVAVPSAQALAIVVGSPELIEVRCKSVAEMRLVNLLCHLVQYAEEPR